MMVNMVMVVLDVMMVEWIRLFDVVFIFWM